RAGAGRPGFVGRGLPGGGPDPAPVRRPRHRPGPGPAGAVHRDGHRRPGHVPAARGRGRRRGRVGRAVPARHGGRDRRRLPGRGGRPAGHRVRSRPPLPRPGARPGEPEGTREPRAGAAVSRDLSPVRPAPPSPVAARPVWRRRDLAEPAAYGVLGLCMLAVLVLTDRGWFAPDTRPELYLAPGRGVTRRLAAWR